MLHAKVRHHMSSVGNSNKPSTGVQPRTSFILTAGLLGDGSRLTHKHGVSRSSYAASFHHANYAVTTSGSHHCCCKLLMMILLLPCVLQLSARNTSLGAACDPGGGCGASSYSNLMIALSILLGSFALCLLQRHICWRCRVAGLLAEAEVRPAAAGVVG
jgi:hypothetical protein